MIRRDTKERADNRRSETSHAEEVAAHDITTITAASTDQTAAAYVARTLYE